MIPKYVTSFRLLTSKSVIDFLRTYHDQPIACSLRPTAVSHSGNASSKQTANEGRPGADERNSPFLEPNDNEQDNIKTSEPQENQILSPATLELIAVAVLFERSWFSKFVHQQQPAKWNR